MSVSMAFIPPVRPLTVPSLRRWLAIGDRDRHNSASDAGWSSLAARRAHNPKVAGSNPAPATTFRSHSRPGFFGESRIGKWGMSKRLLPFRRRHPAVLDKGPLWPLRLFRHSECDGPDDMRMALGEPIAFFMRYRFMRYRITRYLVFMHFRLTRFSNDATHRHDHGG